MKTINSDIVNIKSGINVLIYKPVNIYDCILGDNVFIGPFVEIQRGAKIGNNTRIQSHTFICEDVVIGNDCFIGHNVTFANDLFRASSLLLPYELTASTRPPLVVMAFLSSIVPA